MDNRKFGVMIGVYVVGAMICVATFVTMTSALAFYCW